MYIDKARTTNGGFECRERLSPLNHQGFIIYTLLREYPSMFYQAFLREIPMVSFKSYWWLQAWSLAAPSSSILLLHALRGFICSAYSDISKVVLQSDWACTKTSPRFKNYFQHQKKRYLCKKSRDVVGKCSRNHAHMLIRIRIQKLNG